MWEVHGRSMKTLTFKSGPWGTGLDSRYKLVGTYQTADGSNH